MTGACDLAGAEAAPGMYAVARVGGHCIGIATAHVLQALRRPSQVTALPRRAGAVSGVFDHDGQLVPVVELGHWVALGASDARPEEERLLVLRDGARVVGLRVDAVMGVRRLRADELRRVYHDDRPDELFQSVARGHVDEPLLSLLEPHRLMRLAGAWCAEAGLDAQAGALSRDDAPAVEAGRHETFATFRCADQQIGLRAGDIGELMPTPALETVLPMRHGARGICRWRGRVVPVVDLTQALDAQPDATPAPWVCILRHGALSIGVLVHEVGDLLRADIGGFPRDPQAPSLVLGVAVSAQGGTLQLVDTAGLLAHFPETQLSEPPVRASATHTAGQSDVGAYMVFNAGTPFASPVEAVQEVIALPDELHARIEAELPATLEWRGHAVPVIDLRRVLPMASTAGLAAAPKQLVLLAQGERRCAVAIGGVRALIPARTATRNRIAAGNVARAEMISVDLPDHRASYAVVDLAHYLPPAATDAEPAAA